MDTLTSYPRSLLTMSQEKFNDKVSTDENATKDVEAADPSVVDESTSNPHMHRSLKGRQISMIAIVSSCSVMRVFARKSLNYSLFCNLYFLD